MDTSASSVPGAYIPPPLIMSVGARVRRKGDSQWSRRATVMAYASDLGYADILFMDSPHDTLTAIPVTELEVIENADKEHLIGQVMVGDQLCELWQRSIPHKLGLWNDNHRSNWWVKVLRCPKDYETARDDLAATIRRIGDDLHMTKVPELVKEELYEVQRQLDHLERWRKDPSLWGPGEHNVQWVEFMDRDLRFVWDVKVTAYQKRDHKHDGLRSGHYATLKCNGVELGDAARGRDIPDTMAAAQARIKQWEQHPLFEFIHATEKLDGWPVWYMGQPGRLRHPMLDQGCIMVVYDGPPQAMPASRKRGAPTITVAGFNTVMPDDIEDDERDGGCWYEQGPKEIKADIFSGKFDWKRKVATEA